MESWFSQAGFDVRHDWGRAGARRAADRGDLIVVVDVLRFTTTVIAAVANGFWIRPCTSAYEVDEAVGSHGDIRGGKAESYSLSPLDYKASRIESPLPLVALESPNGATCSRIAANCTVLAGALVNATVLGEYLEKCVTDEVPVTVISCGERWEGEDGPLRFAVDDYIGAGAILNAIERDRKSPEAIACEGAFLSVRDRLTEALESCGSGVELADKGRIDDVRFAAAIDSVPVIAGLVNGVFVLWGRDLAGMTANKRE